MVAIPSVTSRAVFLDRDGVLNVARVVNGRPHSPATLEEFELLPDVVEACGQLRAAGFLLVVATNQPDVGRGTQSRETVEAMHRKLQSKVPIDRIEVCYDAEEGSSECRKPKPGMLLRAARELHIDLRRSYMVGDRWRDVDCGNAAECRTIFIDRGYQEMLRTQPAYRAASLSAAAKLILAVESVA